MKPKFIGRRRRAGDTRRRPPTRRTRMANGSPRKDNPFFAKSTANRVWSYFLGRGIIDPVDDIRASQSAEQSGAARRAHQGFHRAQFRPAPPDADHRQLAHLSGGHRDQRVERGRRDNFSHAIPRRLSAEQLMDAVAGATGVRPALPGCSAGHRGAEQLADPHIGREGFLDLFGRPSRESACECERRSDLSLPQALNLVNGKTISDAVADRNGRVAKAVFERPARSKASSKSCILRALSRPPTPGGVGSGDGVSGGRVPGAPRARRTCCGRSSTAKRFCTTTEADG